MRGDIALAWIQDRRARKEFELTMTAKERESA
jgi:hypothetical protein